MLGAEAEAVRISRLVGLVCCECHIATFFLPIYLEPWFFFFTLTTMFQNFLDTQHRTAPRGLFRFCCERCGSQVFALCTTWSAVAGQSALVAGGCLLFDARTWLGSGRPGRTDQTVSLFQCPFCSCVLGIVFSCFWTFIILCFFAGMGAHQMAAARKAAVLESLPRMPPSRVGHRRPDFKPVLPAPLPAVPPATGRRTLCPGTPS